MLEFSRQQAQEAAKATERAAWEEMHRQLAPRRSAERRVASGRIDCRRCAVRGILLLADGKSIVCPSCRGAAGFFKVVDCSIEGYVTADRIEDFLEGKLMNLKRTIPGIEGHE